jgi:hypothetical protein
VVREGRWPGADRGALTEVGQARARSSISRIELALLAEGLGLSRALQVDPCRCHAHWQMRCPDAEHVRDIARSGG